AKLRVFWSRALPTVTVTLALDPVIEPVLSFCPTRPPAPIAVKVEPFTLPLRTWTLLMVPELSPATAPRKYLLSPPVIVTFAKLRLRTVAGEPPTEVMKGNRPNEFPRPALEGAV